MGAVTTFSLCSIWRQYPEPHCSNRYFYEIYPRLAFKKKISALKGKRWEEILGSISGLVLSAGHFLVKVPILCLLKYLKKLRLCQEKNQKNTAANLEMN